MGAGDWIGDCKTETGKAEQDDDEMNGERKRSNPGKGGGDLRSSSLLQPTNQLPCGNGGRRRSLGLSRPPVCPLPVSLSLSHTRGERERETCERERRLRWPPSPPRDFSHSVACQNPQPTTAHTQHICFLLSSATHLLLPPLGAPHTLPTIQFVHINIGAYANIHI